LWLFANKRTQAFLHKFWNTVWRTFASVRFFALAPCFLWFVLKIDRFFGWIRWSSSGRVFWVYHKKFWRFFWNFDVLRWILSVFEDHSYFLNNMYLQVKN
jgi:hypothetical protein